VAADYVIPWIEKTKRLDSSAVIEYGCGQGAVTCALAARAQRVLGVDIDEGAVSLARQELDRRGFGQVDVFAVAEASILAELRLRDERVDVFLLYAVLEHMTVRERLDVLRLARDTLTEDGVIVVIESPNRLVDPDFHTSFLPFFSQLPDELALLYFERSERPDFTSALRGAVESDAQPMSQLVRWGRGISFHELELVFGDLQTHVLAGGFDPLLFPERLIHAEELALARYMERVRPDLAPCFSRYWIDCVLSARPQDNSGRSFMWPWTMDTRFSPGAGWTEWDNIALPSGTPLVVSLPCPTSRITAVVTTDASPSGVTLRVGDSWFSQPVFSPPGQQALVEFKLDEPAAQVQLELVHSGYVLFVGYEADDHRGSPR
jgi:SAM-dependent methyltransferase